MLLEQLDIQYGPEDRAIKLGGTAELKFGAKPGPNLQRPLAVQIKGVSGVRDIAILPAM